MRRFHSKRELYAFLSHDCHAYLPPVHCINVYFLWALFKGEKEVRNVIDWSLIVYYTRTGEDSLRSSNRWLAHSELVLVRKRKTKYAQISPWSKWLEQYKQKMDLWYLKYFGRGFTLLVCWICSVQKTGQDWVTEESACNYIS
jgi:hypothetical protein